jgi:hypothetical protein
MDEARIKRVAVWAALINAALIALLPLWLELLGRITDSSRGHTAVAVSADSVSLLQGLVPFVPVLVGLALIAGWRTYVHSRRYLVSGARGWNAVIEPGMVGMIITFYLLAPVLVEHPVSGSLYVALYTVGALILGCAIGLVLRCTAMLTLVISNR